MKEIQLLRGSTLQKYSQKERNLLSFFYSMNKKRLEKAQFDELHIVERKDDGHNEIRVVKEQKAVEWEVRKYYWNLYKAQETNVDTEEILESIAELKKVSLDDKSRLEQKVTGEEVSNTLKQTRNNVEPGTLT